eukprot:TRINITY_DN4616_c0_g1_i1.p1 TRINITY_DN4616_c0_g1~~TRINITY_DN4616_c0_g1_i1.p1  ORF type:complete len:298 (-),score=78.33 TRINITY_DN4616_c0_g1_i1:1688-2581(-)
MSMWKKLKNKEKKGAGKAATVQTFDPKTGMRLVDKSEGTFDPKTGMRLDGSGNPIIIADSSKGSNIDLRNSAKENKGAKKIEFRKSKIEMVSPFEGKTIPEEPEFQDNPIRKARALYEYSPEQEDEISLIPGKIILVYEEDDSGWWTGECDGKYGLFPGGFVELIEDDVSSSSHTKDTSPRSKTTSHTNSSNNNYNDMMDMMEDEEFRRLMLGEEEKEKKKDHKKEPVAASSSSPTQTAPTTPLTTSMSSNTSTHFTSPDNEEKLHKLTAHLEQLQSERKMIEQTCLQLKKRSSRKI